MRILYVLSIVLLLIVALLSWQNWDEAPQDSKRASHMAEQKSDYYLEAFHIDTLGPDGRLKHRLSGATLTHYPHDDTAAVDSLRLLLKRAHKADWQISSERGWLTSGAMRVYLLGKVTMIREWAPAAPGMRIDSRDMRLETKSHMLTTDAAVTIVSDRWQAHGDGLRGNTESGDLTLLDKVVIIYAPPL